MTILHVNGFHKVTVAFCGCSSDPESSFDRIQLMRARLFPASAILPQSAFTFACMDLLAQLNSQGKLSTYHFYEALHQLTDNTELDGWAVSFLLRSVPFNRFNPHVEAL